MKNKLATPPGTLGHEQHVVAGVVDASQQQRHALPLLVVDVLLLQPFPEARPLALQALELVELPRAVGQREAVLQFAAG